MSSGIEDISDIKSRESKRSTSVRDIDERSRKSSIIPSRELNSDEPKPSIVPSRELLDKLREIDRKGSGMKRIPLNSRQSQISNRSTTQLRIVPGTPSSRARSYQPQRPVDIIPEDPRMKDMTPDEIVYMYRQKFIRLNDRNPKIEIPNCNDPGKMAIFYQEALKTDHHTTTSSTWIIYMGLGYAGFWAMANWLGLGLPPSFIYVQVTIMTHYPKILKELGDPGGLSLGSSWPPWIKLVIVMAIHTALYILIFKFSGNESAAIRTQEVICGTGLFGGKAQAEEGVADQATAGIGGLLGGLMGGTGGGGFGGIVQNLIGMFTGQKKDDVADIDLNNPPPIVGDTPSHRSNDIPTTHRKTPFD